MPPSKTRPTGTHEQTINTSLGELLQPLGRTWAIRSEDVGRVFEEGGRPDILIEKSDGWPIVIEAEVTITGRPKLRPVRGLERPYPPTLTRCTPLSRWFTRMS